MKVELHMSVAANGLMPSADPSHPTPRAVMMDFIEHARAAGSMVLGRVTYEMARDLGAAAAFEGVTLVVISSREVSGAHRVGSPEEALRYLSDRGHTRTVVGGGAVVYKAFLAASLVDELWINVIPTLTSRGEAITAGAEPRSLRLLSSRELGEGVTQLRFAREG